MHQDYRIHRPTQIRRFADRLEIENPGASLRDPDRLGEPGVDNAAFRSLNHTDTLTASRALTHLEGLGLLMRSEQRRGPGVYYTLAGEAAETPPITPEGTPEVTPKTKAELLRLLAEGKRLLRDDVIAAILFLCAERPHMARELASALHRNVDYVRNSYLSPLVREGRLQLTGAPNDPNVAYRSAHQPGAEQGGKRP